MIKSSAGESDKTNEFPERRTEGRAWLVLKGESVRVGGGLKEGALKRRDSGSTAGGRGIYYQWNHASVTPLITQPSSEIR